MWCVPKLDADYIDCMEDVLNVLARPRDPWQPVVGLDERPVALRGASRPGRPMQAGRIARTDYEYVRRGTANIYCIVEPHAGRHLTHATRDRKTPRFVRALQRIARRYRTAKTIHLIMDNLNLHCRSTVIGVLGRKRGAALWARFTPLHAQHGIRALESARRHWQATSPRRYRMVVSRECFCDARTPFESEVEGVEVIAASGGPRTFGRAVEPELRTVEMLFAEAERLIRSNAEDVQVVFDDERGYPSMIAVDRWRDAIDDEWTWRARLSVAD